MLFLNKSLLEDIKQLKLSKKYEYNAIDLVGLIQKKSYFNNRDLFSFVQLSRSYFNVRYTKRYNEWLNKLIQAKIIISNDSYKIGEYCKSYCINNKYINDINSIIIIVPTILNNSIKKREIKYTERCLNSVFIDYEKLKKTIDFHVNKIAINNFRINENIKENVFEVTIKDKNFEQTYYTTKDKAVIKAKELNKDLIQDKNRFLIIDRDFFIKLKKDAYSFSYNNSLDSLANKKYHIGRNQTNDRLDSNFTNLCRVLVDEICEDNNLMQIDLKNSQFAVLSYLLPENLKENKDVLEFCEMAEKGRLYEYVQAELDLKERKDAKQLTFEVLFSSQNNKSYGIKMFRNRFPNLMNWIDKYKKDNGYENFAIMLQKKESEIFIDGIYKNIIRSKVWSLTKHDSVICKSGDYDKVKQIMEDYFDKIKFKGTLA